MDPAVTPAQAEAPRGTMGDGDAIRHRLTQIWQGRFANRPYTPSPAIQLAM